jgi:hypothetical protein
MWKLINYKSNKEDLMRKIYFIMLLGLIAIIASCGGSSTTGGTGASSATVTFSANFNEGDVSAAFLGDVESIQINYYTMCEVLDYGHEYYDDESSDDPFKDTPEFFELGNCVDEGRVDLTKDNPTATLETYSGLAKFEVFYKNSDQEINEHIPTAGELLPGDNVVKITSLRGAWTPQNPIELQLVNNTEKLGDFAANIATIDKLHIYSWYDNPNINTAQFDPEKPIAFNWYDGIAETTLDNGSKEYGHLWIDYINQFKGGVDGSVNAIYGYGEMGYFYDNTTEKHISFGVDIMDLDPLATEDFTPLSYIDGDTMTGVAVEYISETVSLECSISIDNGSTFSQLDEQSCLLFYEDDIYVQDASLASTAEVKKSDKNIKIAQLLTDTCGSETLTWTETWHTEICYDNATNTISWPEWIYDNETATYDLQCSSGTFYPWQTTIYTETGTEDVEYCTHSFIATRTAHELGPDANINVQVGSVKK